MNEKKDRYLLFAIIGLLLVYYFLDPAVHFSFGNMTYFVVAFSFLFLYQMKRKNWALYVGTFAGFMYIMSIFSNISFFQNMIGGLLFLILGICFFIFFYYNHGKFTLCTGSFLFWFGCYLLASNLFFIRYKQPGLFMSTLGFSFLTIYLLGGKKRFSRFCAFACIIIGMWRMISPF